jgi:hypothetical protein
MNASIDKLIEVQIHELILEYISCARYCCGILRQNVPSGMMLLRAKVIKAISKEGKLDEHLYYKFHGVGVYFEIQDLNISIDVDFGPDERCDGFDLFRIRNFLENFPQKYPELVPEGNLEYGFSKFIEEKKIYHLESDFSDHLFYLQGRYGS